MASPVRASDRRGRSLLERARRCPRAVRAYAEARLATVEDELAFVPDTWLGLVAGSAGVAVVLVGAIRLLQAWSLDSESAVLSWLGFLPGALVAVGCLVLVGWIYWQTYLDSRALRPYVIALLTAVIAVGVCAEVFAGLTALLWTHGVAHADGAAEPALWPAEREYLWELANAIPLLAPTATVGWQDPGVFADHWSGALLLVFKLTLVVPLVQIAIGAYRLLEARWVAASGPVSLSGRLVVFEAEEVGWRLAAAALVCIAALGGILVLLIAPTSPADEWARDHLPAEIGLLGVGVSLRTLQTGADCVVAGVLAFWSLALAELIFDAPRARSIAVALWALLSWLVLLPVLLVLGSVTVTLALLHAGVAEARPALDGPQELEAAIAWFGWHVADAIPFLDVPGSLHWSLDHEFVDVWSGMLLLGLKVVLFATILIPVARLVRSATRHLRRSSPATGHLQAWRDLADELDGLHAQLDAVEEQVVARGHAGFAAAAAQRRARKAGDAVERAVRLFGPGEVSDAANAALLAAMERADELAGTYWRPDMRALEVARVRAAELTARYVRLAAARLAAS